MKNNRVISYVLLSILVLVGSIYYFWPESTGSNRPVKRGKSNPAGTQAAETTGAVSSLTLSNGSTTLNVPLSAMTANISIPDESGYEFHQYTRDSGYKGIGDRDLFCLLIAPPPPPPPPRETIEWLTRNWILWEIVSNEDCVIQDTRTMSHNLRVGEVLEKVKVMKIEPDNNRVQLAKMDDPKEIKWLQLPPLSDVVRGWKLKGTVPGLKLAFVVTGDSKNNKVKEGDILQHIKIKKVLQNKVIFEYGTMSQEIVP